MRDSSIYNYLAFSPRLATGGQPTELEIKQLAEHGCQVVINLGLTGTDYALHGEAALVRELGMIYEHVPVQWELPNEEDFVRFADLMQQYDDKHLFVHCAANKRVSIFMALYNILYKSISFDDAMKIVRRIWEPNSTWHDFMRQVMAADMESKK